MSEMEAGRAYDMTKHQRVIGYEGDRIKGSFLALGNLKSRDTTLIHPIDVLIWDHSARSGICLKSDDVSCWVNPHGVVETTIRHKQADIDDVMDEFEAAMRAIDSAFRQANQEPTP